LRAGRSGVRRAAVRLSRPAMMVTLAAVLAGCQTASDVGERVVGSGPIYSAPLAPLAGAKIDGAVTFRQRGDGVLMVVNLFGGWQGLNRIVIHANGNCTSPNGFSAGPPWVAPGATEPPQVFTAVTDSAGAATLTASVAGVRIDGPDGIAGKAVVIHAGGQGSLEAKPGVPNDRIGCGVIRQISSAF
jgi:Cu-Zn family superoxide dismutase